MSPNDRSSAIPHELLLGQAGFLRRLARDLVGDPHAADDAVQEVMLAALERPPRHDANLHGWLAAVLKNLVSKRSRAHVRRAHHEQEAARTSARRNETLPAESEATVRSVTQAVLALEEPYRSTVLMRYFEELAPSAIAERQSVPVATVKSRLQRALEMLRARMERERGSSWTAGLIGLAWPAAVSHSIPIAVAGKGVLAMSLTTKVAAGAVLVLAAWILVRELNAPRSRTAEPSPDLTPVAVPVEPHEPPTHEPGALEDTTKEPDRLARSADTAGHTSDSEKQPLDTLLYGAVLDPSGSPWRGLLYEGVAIRDASGKSRFADAQVDGTYAFRGLPFGTYWARVDGDELVTLEKQVELRRDQPHLQCDFTLSRAPRLKVKVSTPEGEPFLDALQRAWERNGAHKQLGLPFPVATLGPAEELIKEGGPRRHGLNGVGWFWDFGPKVKDLPKEYAGVLILEHSLPVFVSMIGNQRVLQTKTAEVGDEEVRFVLSVEQFLAGAASISLQVVDASTLAPIQGARVDLEGEVRSLHGWNSDANGMVLIHDHQPGQFQLRVAASGHENLTRIFTAEPGATTELGQVLLGEEIQFQARVLDSTGATCSAGFKLGQLDSSTGEIVMEWRSYEELGDPTRETTTWRERLYGSDNEGILRLRHLGRHVYVLRTDDVARQGGQVDLASRWTSGNIILDLRSGTAPKDMVIRLERAAWLVLKTKDEQNAALHCRVLAADGLERGAAEVRNSAPCSLPLPPGNYRIELLDSGGRRLSNQSVTLGPGGETVESSR